MLYVCAMFRTSKSIPAEWISGSQGPRDPFGGDATPLEVDCGGGCITLDIPKATELYTKRVNFKVCGLDLNKVIV